jgi:hypothetical protein
LKEDHTSAGEEEGETVTNTTSQKTSQLDKSAERKGPIKAVLQIMFKKRLFFCLQNRIRILKPNARLNIALYKLQ